MKIALGSDHAGFRLKTEIVEYLSQKGYEVMDLGTYDLSSCDYSDYGLKVGQAVVKGEAERGILVCGTGLGISIAANKIPGIRAAHCTDTFSARSSRQHNNANILALGERVTGTGLAFDIVDSFLTSEFEGGRHELRINKIAEIEKLYNK
jgi:ribose 5-phosphate isomerase B